MNFCSIIVGILDILAMLTSVGSVSEEQFRLQFDMMRRCPNTYFIAVLEDKKSGQIIGCATLLLEYKFIHSAGEASSTRVGTAWNVIVYLDLRISISLTIIFCESIEKRFLGNKWSYWTA